MSKPYGISPKVLFFSARPGLDRHFPLRLGLIDVNNPSNATVLPSCFCRRDEPDERLREKKLFQVELNCPMLLWRNCFLL